MDIDRYINAQLGKFSKSFLQKSVSLVLLQAQQYFRHRIIGLVFLKAQVFKDRAVMPFRGTTINSIYAHRQGEPSVLCRSKPGIKRSFSQNPLTA